MNSALLSAVFIILATIAVGSCIGKLKVKGINLGLSAILLIAVALGCILVNSKWINLETEQLVSITGSAKTISTLGTAMFIAAVGLMTGKSFLGLNSKNALRSFVLGSFTIVFNFCVMFIIFVLDKSIDKYLIQGVFCGAMTSTPALSVLSEDVQSNIASIGYGVAYLPGVILVVLFVQVIALKIENNNVAEVNKSENKYILLKMDSIILVTISSALGYLLNGVLDLVFGVSLGNTGGILLASSLVGYICAKKNICAIESELNLMRNIGLSLFLSATGLTAGINVINGFDLRCLLYGVILTVVPIGVSYFISRKVYKCEISQALWMVCGVMTSSPAAGVLLNKKRNSDDILIYSATYAGALMTLIIGARVIM